MLSDADGEISAQTAALASESPSMESSFRAAYWNPTLRASR